MIRHMKIIVGLGNPTDQYEHTRHNVGRDIVEKFRKKHKFDGWEFDKKANALVTEGKIGRTKVLLMLPETYMNDSGSAVAKYVKSKKQAADLCVVYDDLDLGVGTQKLSFNKGSGGHKGIDSTIRKIKTKEFARLRIGIAPVTPTGKVKKVQGEEAVKKHVLTKFKPTEEAAIKKVMTKGVTALEHFVADGYILAANTVNSW